MRECQDLVSEVHDITKITEKNVTHHRLGSDIVGKEILSTESLSGGQREWGNAGGGSANRHGSGGGGGRHGMASPT